MSLKGMMSAKVERGGRDQGKRGSKRRKKLHHRRYHPATRLAMHSFLSFFVLFAYESDGKEINNDSLFLGRCRIGGSRAVRHGCDGVEKRKGGGFWKKRTFFVALFFFCSLHPKTAGRKKK